MRTRRDSIIGQWREHINAMSNALRDFEADNITKL